LICRQEYVLQEAEALGIADFFQGRIFGAQGDSEVEAKETIIQHILSDYRLAGEKLLVVGDGLVEIQFARRAGAISLGVACNESDRLSLDVRKRQRLVQAGADLIVSNYLHSSELVDILC
jgi:phosphoglycolate phosphatase-like HAD superfamily hydrolase